MNKMLLSAVALSMSFTAFAQDQTPATNTDSQTKMKIEEAADRKNKVDGDIDQEITNAKLRAESGSKSRYSLSFTANYAGGSLREPFSKNRPNLTNDPVIPKVTMGGEFGGRYRIDKNQSLSLGIGYALERPFHEAQRGQISNPSLSYNYVAKLGPVQNVSSASVGVTTNSDQVTIGDVGGLGLSNTVIYDFGGSKTSVGLAAEVGYTHFNKKNEIVEPKGQPRTRAIRFQEDYSVAAYPFAEYAFSDKVNLRTVFRPWIFTHRRVKDGQEFNHRPWTQSFGVGFAVTRDVFVYPNFQWDWERWRRDDFNWFKGQTARSATVALSVTANVF